MSATSAYRLPIMYLGVNIQQMITSHTYGWRFIKFWNSSLFCWAVCPFFSFFPFLEWEWFLATLVSISPSSSMLANDGLAALSSSSSVTTTSKADTSEGSRFKGGRVGPGDDLEWWWSKIAWAYKKRIIAQCKTNRTKWICKLCPCELCQATMTHRFSSRFLLYDKKALIDSWLHIINTPPHGIKLAFFITFTSMMHIHFLFLL